MRRGSPELLWLVHKLAQPDYAVLSVIRGGQRGDPKAETARDSLLIVSKNQWFAFMIPILFQIIIQNLKAFVLNLFQICTIIAATADRFTVHCSLSIAMRVCLNQY